MECLKNPPHPGVTAETATPEQLADIRAWNESLPARMRAESRGEPVKTPHGCVTRGALEDAFNLVCDKDHWKNPIDCKVQLTDDQVCMIADAVTFFAGCVPTFKHLPPHGNVQFNNGGVPERLYQVTAEGYYKAVGA